MNIRKGMNLNADVILICGGGRNEVGEIKAYVKERIEKAIELQKLGYADKIIMTGKNVSELMYEYAIKKGIEKSSIWIENESTSTAENIQILLKKYLIPNNMHILIIVSSYWHTKRIKKILVPRYLKNYQCFVIDSVDSRDENDIQKLKNIKDEKWKSILDKLFLSILTGKAKYRLIPKIKNVSWIKFLKSNIMIEK